MYSDYCKIDSKCASFGSYKQKRKALRKMNGYMDNAKYQSEIIHDIEMTLCCVPTKRAISVCMISRHAIALKVVEDS